MSRKWAGGGGVDVWDAADFPRHLVRNAKFFAIYSRGGANYCMFVEVNVACVQPEMAFFDMIYRRSIGTIVPSIVQQFFIILCFLQPVSACIFHVLYSTLLYLSFSFVG